MTSPLKYLREISQKNIPGKYPRKISKKKYPKKNISEVGIMSVSNTP